MLTSTEDQQFAKLLEKAEWPLSRETFFAFCAMNIVASLDLALIRRRNASVEVLLTLRPSDDPFFGDLWHIPGGVIMPGETALSTMEKRVMQSEVGVNLLRAPEFLMARDILMGPPSLNTSPRGQEAFRLFQYVLQECDAEIEVSETKRFFRLDEIPASFVHHQLPNIDWLRTVHDV